MGKYIVIEDLESFDCYSVMSKADYSRRSTKDKEMILFTGSAETCNQWVIDNPHPHANDFKAFYDDKLDDETSLDDTGFFI